MQSQDVEFARKILLGKLISEGSRRRDGSLRLTVLDGFNWLASKEDLESPQYYWLIRYGVIGDNVLWDEYLSEVVYRILISYDKNFPVCPQQWRGTWNTPIQIKMNDPSFKNYCTDMKDYLDKLVYKYRQRINQNLEVISRTMRGIVINTDNLWWI